jgi:2-octaprenyl-6-methoxyphenol hydroxylase
MPQQSADIIVVGGGPAGLMAAIALANAGIATVLVAKPLSEKDHRTTALLAGSVAALQTLGVWEACRPNAAPLRTMRIIDDTARLLRAPEVHFDAGEIGQDAFGYNIENRYLVAALEARARALPALTLFACEAVDIAIGDEQATITLTSGERLNGRLVIGADGRHSLCRRAAGIETDGWRYPQTALTFNLAHTRPHHDTSTEFHTETGPFTLVPLPGQRSSLVFVVGPAQARRLMKFDDTAISAEIERRSHSILGKVSVEPGRGLFPLAVENARTVAANRVALVGEAAHVIPPIGAQGLNLGLRDGASIAELAVEAHRDHADPGSPEILARYDTRRRADIGVRTFAVDLLNRSLLSDFLPVQGARGLGLWLLERIGPLRRTVMREGVAPASAQPRLMRGEAL